MSTLAGLRRAPRARSAPTTAPVDGLPGVPGALGAVAGAAPRVNLLPPEVSGRRAVKAVQRRTGAAAVGVLALIAAAWVVGHAEAVDQAERLDAANARVQALQAQQAQYAAAPQTQKRVEDAEAARATAMEQDVRWYEYVDSLTRALPAGTWLLGTTTALGTDAAGTTTTTAGEDPTASAPIGTVTISARSTGFEDVAAYLDALASVPGMSDAYLTASSLSDDQGAPVVTFSVTAEVTDAALTHRFDPKEG